MLVLSLEGSSALVKGCAHLLIQGVLVDKVVNVELAQLASPFGRILFTDRSCLRYDLLSVLFDLSVLHSLSTYATTVLMALLYY